MTLPQYEQFIFDSVLLDWDAEGERMRKIADVFDAADEVRIVGAGTDLKLSLAGRWGAVDDGHVNMPGGEVFYSPVEDSARGVIEFCEFPPCTTDARCQARGRVPGRPHRRRVGEIGRGVPDQDAPTRTRARAGSGARHRLQPGHPAVHEERRVRREDRRHRASRRRELDTFTGGTNTSSIHWDIVKDLRAHGELYADGKLVQKNGTWVIP